MANVCGSKKHVVVACAVRADVAMGKAPSMLEALLKEQAREVRKGRPRKKSPLPKGERPTWRCCTCGTILTTLVACERHSEQEGHRRIESVMDLPRLGQ